MPEKTGKSLEEWKVILKEKSFEKHGQAMKFLKEEYGVSHGFANTIILLSKDTNTNADDLVSGQYKGKEELQPIYDKLLSEIGKLGTDITITPKKGSVSIIRKRQFALIKPATKTRIDLGLKLKEVDFTDRLGNSGPFGTMCTHRVQLFSVDEVDTELVSWLKEAYEQSI
jgi:predicted transport protein